MKEKGKANNVNSRLKRIRIFLGFNLDEFSQLLKISKPTLVRYESGERKPTTDFLSILINEYKVNVNWLLTGKGSIFLGKNSIVSEDYYGESELTQLVELFEIPEIRRGILAEFDKLKTIFKISIQKFYGELKEKAGE
jgi:transcriptional regulator with XRE-family HTH domain